MPERSSKARTPKSQTSTMTDRAYERSLAEAGHEVYVLRLYVCGLTPRSQKAIERVQKLCREYLADRHELEIVDIYQFPEMARDEQIVAAPTLIKKLPLPLRRLIGDLSDTGRVLVALGIRENPGADA